MYLNWRSVVWTVIFGVGVLGNTALCADEGFKPLFDGKTLSGWRALDATGEAVAPAESAFSVKDGLLYCSGKGDDYWVVAPGTYGDFTLRLEYKLVKKANSGVFLRVPKAGHPAYLGFEVQIMGDSGEDPSSHSTGAIYDVLTPMRNMAKPEGEWNQFQITCKGSRVRVVLNDFKVIDTDFAKLTQPIGKFTTPYSQLPLEGWLGVQNHGGEIWYRNIEVKELK
jgi:hypothetical protein